MKRSLTLHIDMVALRLRTGVNDMAFLWICPLVLVAQGESCRGWHLRLQGSRQLRSQLPTVNGQTQQATKHGTHAGLFVHLASIAGGSLQPPSK